MKKTLAYKSISEIVATIIVLILMSLLSLSLVNYYEFNFLTMPDVILIITIVIVIIIIVSILQLMMLLRNPKIMLEHDEKYIYYYHGKNHKKIVEFEKIQNIIARTSIWTKPFVVYTAIVIDIEGETIYFRHIAKMNEVKDYIQHIAYHEDIK